MKWGGLGRILKLRLTQKYASDPSHVRSELNEQVRSCRVVTLKFWLPGKQG